MANAHRESGGPQAGHQRPAARDGIQAADVAAHAGRRVAGHGDVADAAGHAVLAPHHLAANDHPAPDHAADLDAQQDLGVRPGRALLTKRQAARRPAPTFHADGALFRGVSPGLAHGARETWTGEACVTGGRVLEPLAAALAGRS